MNRIVAFFFFSFFVCLGASGQTQTAIRLICGGKAYTDSKGNAWQADFGYNEGTVSANANTIAGTADPTLYHSGRWNGVAATPLLYTFPVASGSYHVNLYFAETSGMTTGVRVFNVRMQGQLIFQNLDIYAAAGANTALVKGADIAVTNGQLQIEFDNLVQNPKINAIEILQTTSAPVLKMSFVYPDGTPVPGTLNYQINSTQLSMAGSTPLTNGGAECYMFSSPAALGLSGTIQVNLSLVDTGGHSLWQVNMAMDPSSANFVAVLGSTLSVVVQKL